MHKPGIPRKVYYSIFFGVIVGVTIFLLFGNPVGLMITGTVIGVTTVLTGLNPLVIALLFFGIVVAVLGILVARRNA